MATVSQDIDHFPPSPPTDFIGGHLLSIRRDPPGFFTQNMLDYGGLVHLQFGKYHAYQVNDPQLIQQILTRDAKIWHKSVVYKTILSDYLGNGLLISDGAFWRRQRKLMQPAFHSKRISSYASTMVDYTQRLLTTWQTGATRDIDSDMMQLTLNIVGKTLFDTDLHDSSGQVAEALDYMLNDIALETRKVRWVRLPKWMPTPLRLRRQQAIDHLNQVVNPIIEARRADPSDNGDLLSMLLLAEDDDGNRMTDAQVRDEALTLVLAGHETTANALTWTLYLLSQNHDVEAQLQAEIDSVLQGRAPTLEDLPNLPYTEMVIKESMRLYPPAWSVARQVTEATELGGYPVQKRAVALVVAYALHRNPDIFPQPERFDPQRFTLENEAQIPRYAYVPFGGGPRVCIGNAFAMMEARLILASIIQRYMLTRHPQQVVEPEALVTLRPKHGMKMIVTERHAQP